MLLTALGFKQESQISWYKTCQEKKLMIHIFVAFYATKVEITYDVVGNGLSGDQITYYDKSWKTEIVRFIAHINEYGLESSSLELRS
jgi:hypothetical protein